MTITYPKESGATKETFGVGARVDVDAKRVHEVWMGEEGCEYVIGEMWGERGSGKRIQTQSSGGRDRGWTGDA